MYGTISYIFINCYNLLHLLINTGTCIKLKFFHLAKWHQGKHSFFSRAHTGPLLSQCVKIYFRQYIWNISAWILHLHLCIQRFVQYLWCKKFLNLFSQFSQTMFTVFSFLFIISLYVEWEQRGSGALSNILSTSNCWSNLTKNYLKKFRNT